ncbi:MAG: ABC transporter ATP-binding protein [Actinomycetota bacterium]
MTTASGEAPLVKVSKQRARPLEFSRVNANVVVRATDLHKRYQGSSEIAVNGIDFAVQDGECFGFLGPNGAGKTTTMSMISCRVARTSGSLEVLGLDPETDERDIKRVIGVVPQGNFPDNLLNVIENLEVYARFFDIPRDEAHRRATELLDFVQLGDRAQWNVENLSGGMKRRLLIARGLINQPRLLILDEPTTGLDPQARHLVWEKLRDLRRRGVTLLITTHYMEEAAHLCDRLVIMHQGRILVEGSPARLIAEHVAPEVVELAAGDHQHLADLQALVGTYASGSEIAGDRLILHTGDGEVLLKTIGSADVPYETATLRQATLEDVFLKLTGRTLEE